MPDYQCVGESIEAGGSRCLVVPGSGVERAISELLLETVSPLALEVALEVEAELEARSSEADALRRSHLERARQRAELAQRRYLAVDPANRVVADSLEADWNEALRALEAARDDYERASAAAKEKLSAERKAEISALAADFSTLWSDPATPQRERKRMVRLVIEDVTLQKSDRIHLHVRFRGGATRGLELPIPKNAWQERQTDPDTLALIDRLLDQHTDAEVAERLNEAERRSGAGKPFTARIVLGLRRNNGLRSHAERLRARGMLTREELAARLGIHPHTVRGWERAGLVMSHRADDKNRRLFEPPALDDPRLRKRQGVRLDRREPTKARQGGAV